MPFKHGSRPINPEGCRLSAKSVISQKALFMLHATANAQSNASIQAEPQVQAQPQQAGIASIPYFGGAAKYVTPNQLTQWRVQTFHSKERDTLAWIETFAADDVLVDIGANVGMYSIWAAATRGVRVISFEPESQNYALLNQNIFINGLSDQISAYCMAIAENSGFDKFYLGRFEAGGSCHTFGEALDPNLAPIKAQFSQGCFAAPLDELIEAGVAPAPTHIKVDVDGLEHAVVAGMAGTLHNPALKSVLVEINANLAEHQAILAHMAEIGFHVDDRQRAASLQTEGFFKGAGNVIFWRDVADAERLGAILAGETPAAPPQIQSQGPKLAGLSVSEAFEAVQANIADATVSLDPTPHWYVDQVFPQDFYNELMVRMPEPSAFTSITEMGWVTDGGGSEAQRGVLELSAQALQRLDPELAGFWQEIGKQFRTENFALTMLRKFLPHIAERYGDDVGTMRFSATPMLLSDNGNYALGPHTDRMERVLAALFYLPAAASSPELGTSLYLPKDPTFTCPGGPHHSFDKFQRVATMPYAPNSAFCFFKTDTSFHGVEPVPGEGQQRRLFSYILETA